MKKFRILGADKYGPYYVREIIAEFTIGPGCDVADEYHTMHELYQHRMALTVALTRYYRMHQSFVGIDRVANSFRSKLHADGTMFEGDYFIVGFTNNENKCIISYHYQMKHWHLFDHCITLDRAPEYDGHTSQDTIERLKEL